MIKLDSIMNLTEEIINSNPSLLVFVAIHKSVDLNKLSSDWQSQWNKVHVKEIQYVKEHNQLVFHLDSDFEV